MDYSFKKHKLSEAEKIWLQEVSQSEAFDPKVLKVKVHDKLPESFDPEGIDQRLYKSHHLTLLGLWLVNPNDSIFVTIDKIISTIRSLIMKEPGIEKITSDAIAQETGINEDMVAKVLYDLGQLGQFYSSATGPGDPGNFTSIDLSGPTAYDEYLHYKGIDSLLERAYVPRKSASIGNTWVTDAWVSHAGRVSEGIQKLIHFPEDKLVNRAIKPNTAFVLMPIDTTKPELEDVYNSIKDVCQLFGISAYRADDIEHQDRITDLVLSEIRTCEFLIADLSYERPNVYYEVGYAHAINKKPILYRKTGTRLHFDLSVHNVPEYKNVTELRDLLRKRVEAILGRQVKEI